MNVVPWGCNLEVVILESGSGVGPDGAKGVGESAAVAAPTAIANALYDALGSQLTCISATPVEIVELCTQANHKSTEHKAGPAHIE